MFRILVSGKDEQALAEDLSEQLLKDKLHRGIMFEQVGIAENVFKLSLSVNNVIAARKMVNPNAIIDAVDEYLRKASPDTLTIRGFIKGFKHEIYLKRNRPLKATGNKSMLDTIVAQRDQLSKRLEDDEEKKKQGKQAGQTVTINGRQVHSVTLKPYLDMTFQPHTNKNKDKLALAWSERQEKKKRDEEAKRLAEVARRLEEEK